AGRHETERRHPRIICLSGGKPRRVASAQAAAPMNTPILLVALVSAIAGAVIAVIAARASAAAAARRTEQMRDTFQALAAEALSANRAAFLDLAKTQLGGMQKEAAMDLTARQTAIDGLVQPLAATLKEVHAKLAQAETDRAGAYAKLAEQIAALSQTTHTLSR